MANFRFLLFFALLLVIHSTGARAQAPSPDSAILAQAIQHLSATYREAFAGNAHLYNGTEYVSSDKYHLIGHPDFIVDTLVAGSVFYDGILYENNPMVYDIREDELVINNYNTNFKMKLIKEKINYFNLNGHTFRKYATDTITSAPFTSGFYDVLHQGSVNLIVKRIKMITESARQNSLTGEFLSSTKFFIQKNGRYYPVKNKSSVLKVLAVNKSLLQRQLRADKIKYRKNREKAILKLVQYYDANRRKEAI